MTQPYYRIYDTGRRQYWTADQMGYTLDVAAAGVFSAAEIGGTPQDGQYIDPVNRLVQVCAEAAATAEFHRKLAEKLGEAP